MELRSAAPGGPGSDEARARTLGGDEVADPRAGAMQQSAAFRAAQRQAHVPPDTVIDHKYAVVRVLGEGGMGVVYLARDVHTGASVVLKAVRSELAHRQDVRERTLAEGRALAQIDHPNVVHLKAIVVEGESMWLVMQYIDGESLEDRIQRYIQEKRPMPVDEVLRIFRQIVAGIDAAHGEGVIHRDLKPGNVLIRSKDGTAKVTDFGIAKIEEDARTGKGQTEGIIGSLWYMSPEQVTGRRDLDKRVDIYALGIVLFEMLVGRVPFDGDSDYEIMKLHLKAPVPRVSQMRRDVPEAVDTIIQKACAKERDDRFADCAELLTALSGVVAATAPEPRAKPEAASGLDSSAASRPTTKDEGPAVIQAQEAPKRRWGVWVAAVIAVLVLGGAGALTALGFVPDLSWVPGASSVRKDTVTSPDPSAGKAPPGAPGAHATSSSPLAALTGAWVVDGRDLDAVLSGDRLEFRVRDPAEFATQGYAKGEVRFALRALPGEVRAFAVEDHLRPSPPRGTTYDLAKASVTCSETRTSADNQALRATFDGARLTVDLARVEPGSANFTAENGKITSCTGLRSLPATKLIRTLTRP